MAMASYLQTNPPAPADDRFAVAHASTGDSRRRIRFQSRSAGGWQWLGRRQLSLRRFT